MLGSNSLRNHLTQLVQHHGVQLTQPRRVPLAPPPAHPSLIIEGIASNGDIDVDRVRFAPGCFGSTLPTVPLLIEHTGRPVTHVQPTYDNTRSTLRVRTQVSGDAARYGAFSVGVRNISFTVRNAGSPNFHLEISSATLTEISLTEYPHLPAALVATRLRPNPQVEFYSHAQRGFEIIGRKLAILQSQMEVRR